MVFFLNKAGENFNLSKISLNTRVRLWDVVGLKIVTAPDGNWNGMNSMET